MAQVPAGATLIDAGDLWFPLVVVENVYIFPGIPELLRKKFESARERFRGVPFVLKRVYVTRMESEIARAPARAARGVPRAPPRLLSAHPGGVVPRAAHARVARRGLCAARARLAARPPAGRRGPPRGVTDATLAEAPPLARVRASRLDDRGARPVPVRVADRPLAAPRAPRAPARRRAARARCICASRRPAWRSRCAGAALGPLSVALLRDWTPMSSFHALLGGIAAVLFAGAALQGRRLERGDDARAQRARAARRCGGVDRARGGDRGVRAAS